MTDYSASEDEASEHMSSMPGSVKQVCVYVIKLCVLV